MTHATPVAATMASFARNGKRSSSVGLKAGALSPLAAIARHAKKMAVQYRSVSLVSVMPTLYHK